MYEKILFNITYGTECERDQDPCAEILLNQQIVIPKQPIKNNQQVEFELDLEKDTQYKLTINRTNHNSKNKQVLSIKSFHADGIDLNRVLDHMYFYPQYPAIWYKQQIESGNELPEKQKGWRDWGFNGQWVMNFETPFYTWLLKTI
jgi:hypothetical protein|tara:strand:+ start:675 stop:1112 length:438 start_codon:yes stop_codon:yes gene_type:complete